MAIGVSIRIPDGVEVATVSRFFGQGTNNLAEYHAAIAGVRAALEYGADEIELRMDSQLVVKQMTGEFKVKKEELRSLQCKLSVLLTKFKKWSVQHVRREENTRADELANLACESDWRYEPAAKQYAIRR